MTDDDEELQMRYVIYATLVSVKIETKLSRFCVP